MSKPLVQKKATYSWVYLISNLIDHVVTTDKNNWIQPFTYSRIISDAFSPKIMDEICDKSLTLEKLYKIFATILGFDGEVKFDDAKKNKIFGNVMLKFRNLVEEKEINPQTLRETMLDVIEEMNNFSSLNINCRNYIQSLKSKITKDAELTAFAWGLLRKEILDFLDLKNPLLENACKRVEENKPQEEPSANKPRDVPTRNTFYRRFTIRRESAYLEFDAIPEM